MASIQDQLKNARTLEDIINLLTILFTNMNNQNNLYYDMFFNPEKLYLDLERYDENGKLTTVSGIPNLAASRMSAKSGAVDPNGVESGDIGALYINYTTNTLWYKVEGGGSTGWTKVWSATNLSGNGDEFLAPNGNGSELTNLNASNVSSGVLRVPYGGSGVGSITGIIKGNGTSAFTPAVDGVDYLGPDGSTGMVSFYPVLKRDEDENIQVPNGWLVCDGSEYSVSEYPRLAAVLGSTYGGSGDATFAVPNLIGKYIKGGIENVGSSGSAIVGEHKHTFGGDESFTNIENEHVHDRGNMNITGVAGTSWMSGSGWNKNDYATPTATSEGRKQINGCFFKIKSGEKVTGYNSVTGEPQFEADKNYKYYGTNDGATSNNDPGMGLSAALSWTGVTGKTSHRHSIPETNTSTINPGEKNDVDHVVMIPIIKY